MILESPQPATLELRLMAKETLFEASVRWSSWCDGAVDAWDIVVANARFDPHHSGRMVGTPLRCSSVLLFRKVLVKIHLLLKPWQNACARSTLL